MASLNKWMGIGNLTRDPELRYTPKGTAIAEISLAINRKWKADNGESREECTFVEVTMFGKTAELAEKYLKKGRPVYIEGRLQLETWDDKQTGQKRSKMKVICEEMQFLEGRDDAAESSGGDRRQQSQQQRPTGQQPTRPFDRRSGPPKPPVDPDLDVEQEDIPF